MIQIIYVLTNKAMPGLVKIGKTNREDISTRMNELYSTGVPMPFDCVFATEVENCSEAEKALHTAFSPDRLNPKREFFAIEPEQVVSILKVFGKNNVTPDLNKELKSGATQEELDSGKKLKKRPVLNYFDLGIKEGEELIFKDGETIALVKTGRKVIFRGEEMSLTNATMILFEADYGIHPAPYWSYNGKLLKSIYDEYYSDY